IVGLVIAPRARIGRVFHWWLFAITSFVILAGEGNTHPWYQLPLVPVTAAFAGVACDSVLLRSGNTSFLKTSVIAACVVLFAGFAYLSFRSLKEAYDPWTVPLMEAGREVDRITPPSALIAVADGGDATAIYYSRRRGWHFPEYLGMHWGDPADSEQIIQDLE